MMICKCIMIISNDIPLLNVDFRKCSGILLRLWHIYSRCIQHYTTNNIWFGCVWKWSIPPQMAFLSEWKWWISGCRGGLFWAIPTKAWGVLMKPSIITVLHDWRWLRPMGKYRLHICLHILHILCQDPINEGMLEKQSRTITVTNARIHRN